MKNNIYLLIILFNILIVNVLNAQKTKKSFKLYFSGSLTVHQFKLSPIETDGIFVGNIELPNRFTFARASKNLSIGLQHKLNRNLSLTYSIGYTARNAQLYYQQEELSATVGDLGSINSQLTFNILKNQTEKIEKNQINLLDFGVGGRYYFRSIKNDLKPYAQVTLKPAFRFTDSKIELAADTGIGVSFPFLGQQLNLEPFLNYSFISRQINENNTINIRPTSGFGLRAVLSTAK